MKIMLGKFVHLCIFEKKEYVGFAEAFARRRQELAQLETELLQRRAAERANIGDPFRDMANRQDREAPRRKKGWKESD